MATKESFSKLLEMPIDSILELIKNCGDEIILIKKIISLKVPMITSKII